MTRPRKCEACEEWILHDDGWTCSECGVACHGACEQAFLLDTTGEVVCDSCRPGWQAPPSHDDRPSLDETSGDAFRV